MESGKERDEFRRIDLGMKLARAEGIIASYREGIDHYRRRAGRYHELIGFLSSRLGDVEPEDPQ